MKKSGIYMIKNILDGKVYIGQSSDLKRRKYDHFYCLKTNQHRNSRLQRAFNKYGEENFKFEILELCPREKLDEMEEFYIKKYNSLKKGVGYNLMGVEFKNYTHNEETRKKISKANKGKIKSKETRLKLSLAHKGKKMPKEAVEKMKMNRKGKCLGENNNWSVISNEKAEEILLFLHKDQTLSIKDVSIKFDVSYDIVYNLKENISYKNILPHLREEIKELYRIKNSSARTRLKDGELVAFTEKVLLALKMIDEGKSQNSVSKELNISRNTIRKALKQRQANTEITNESKDLLVS